MAKEKSERQQKIEEFLLNPDKVIFESIEELSSAVSFLQEKFGDIDLTELENIQGVDGKTPEKGKDYLTDEELNGLEAFILEKVPKPDKDYPTSQFVIDYINNAVAKIPRVKGDPGRAGKNGQNGKDGSPDTPDEVVSKIKKVKGAKRLGFENVKGLKNVVKHVKDHDDDIEKLKKDIKDYPVALNPDGGGGASTFSGLTDTPANYTGHAGKVPVVNVGETALEYTALTGGGDMLAATYDPTAKNGDAFAMDNMVESATKKILSDTERAKLSAIEPNATADQTGPEIKAAYEAEANTNAYDDAAVAKLANAEVQTNKGVVNGYAELDATGKVPTAQLPAFVDDVLEYANFAAFPATGETGKIYVTLDTNITYRWSGSAYVEISASLALGETSTTAYRGDRGKIAYDHSQDVTTNPHSVTKSQVGLGNADNTSDVNKPVSTAQQTALDLKSDTTHNHSGTYEPVDPTLVRTTAAQTLTIKRIKPRLGTTTSAVTITPVVTNHDHYSVTALAVNTTFAAPTGTPADGERLVIRILDNGTSRTLTWNAIYRAIGVTLPTATTASKTIYVGCMYNNADTKWDVIAVAEEA